MNSLKSGCSEKLPYINASDTNGSCKKNQSPFLKDGDGNAVLKMAYFGEYNPHCLAISHIIMSSFVKYPVFNLMLTYQISMHW